MAVGRRLGVAARQRACAQPAVWLYVAEGAMRAATERGVSAQLA
jgi:hypothetical protein